MKTVAAHSSFAAPPLILVVDDEDPLLLLFSMVLRARGYQVMTAKNGYDALALIDTEQPALVISDVMMPKLSGDDLCRELRRRPDTRHIPIILMSAAVPGSINYPAVEFLPKPFDLEVLEHVVATVLAERSASPTA